MTAFAGGELAPDYHWAYFEGAHHGIAHLDKDGMFLHANDAFCRTVRRNYPELMLLSFDEITDAPYKDADITQAQAVIKGRISKYKMEKNYISPAPGYDPIPVLLVVFRIPKSSKYRFLHFVAHIYPTSPLTNVKYEVDKSGAVTQRTTTNWLDFLKDNPAFAIIFGILVILGGLGEQIVKVIGDYLMR